MKTSGFKERWGDFKERMIICAVVGVLMIAPAFIAWYGFRPNVVGVAYPDWYPNYVSSPLGSGSGPLRIGWLLILVAAFVFIVFLVRIDASRNRVRLLICMAIDLVLYLCLLVGQDLQFKHWSDSSSGHFIDPSGRNLTNGIAGGWGSVIGIAAVLIAGVAIFFEAANLETMLKADEFEMAK